MREKEIMANNLSLSGTAKDGRKEVRSDVLCMILS